MSFNEITKFEHNKIYSRVQDFILICRRFLPEEKINVAKNQFNVITVHTL